MKSDHSSKTKTIVYATAETLEARNSAGVVMTPAGKTVVLSEDEGYAHCTEIDAHVRLFGDDTRLWREAYDFKTVENALKRWREWDGHPWYYKLRPGSLRVFRRTVRVVTTVETTEFPLQKRENRSRHLPDRGPGAGNGG